MKYNFSFFAVKEVKLWPLSHTVTRNNKALDSEYVGC